MTDSVPFLALIVDDSRSARFALGKFLESLSLVADSAADLDSAAAYLDSHSPNILFLDYEPEDMAFDTLRSLKAHPVAAQIPVVLCSSDNLEGLTDALTSGAAALMIKPPVRDELSNLLQQLLPGYLPPEMMEPMRGMLPTDGSAPVWENEAGEAPAWDDVPVPPLPLVEEQALPEDRIDSLAQELALQAQDIRAGIAAIDPYTTPATAPMLEPKLDFAVPPPALEATALAEEYTELPDFAEPMPEPATESAPPDARLLQVEARLRLLEQNVQSQLMELRMQLDLNLRAQIERIEQGRESIRALVSQEAKVVAERTVMGAAEQMSDRLAESILKTLGKS